MKTAQAQRELPDAADGDDHVHATARRIVLRDGIGALTRKAVAAEAGIALAAVGRIDALTDHLIDYVFAALLAVHNEMCAQTGPNRWQTYRLIEDLLVGEPELATLTLIVCTLGIPAGSSANDSARHFRRIRRAAVRALTEDATEGRGRSMKKAAAQEYAEAVIEDFIEIAARTWHSSSKSLPPIPTGTTTATGRSHAPADPLAAGERSEPARGQILTELRQARRGIGCSQKALASRIGVSPQTIKRLERGVGSVTTLVAAMEALDFSLTGLKDGDTLADQLTQSRGKRSKTEIGAKAGLSAATVAALERGRGTVRSLLSVLAVLAPHARRRAPERVYWGRGKKSDRDSHFTPAEFMAPIYAAFGEVDLDPCGHLLSPVKAKRRILRSEGGDGLVEDWSGDLVFMNPPFSQQLRWLRRAHNQWLTGNVKTVICLVPVRTDADWFHDTLFEESDIFLIRGRVAFLKLDAQTQTSPFSLMIVAFGASDEQKQRYARLARGVWIAGKTFRADQQGQK